MFNEVSRMFQSSFKGVLRGFKGRFKVVSWNFQGCFKSIAEVFLGSFKVFRGCSKAVLLFTVCFDFQGGLKKF